MVEDVIEDFFDSCKFCLTRAARTGALPCKPTQRRWLSAPDFAHTCHTVLASPAAFSGREDCLTLNVQRPGGVKAGDDLPVLLWIFGGGFELGSTAMYDGAHVVEESVALGKPVIFAEMNYRVAGFGFLPGKEYARTLPVPSRRRRR